MQTDRVVVITGAAGGMGSLFVDRFLANGDTVIATDIKDEALETLKHERSAGTKLVIVAGDISQEADCNRFADVSRQHAGRVNVLVNCAGHFLMIRAMLPLMKGRGWGRIINIGSASIFEGLPGQAHYVAAKAGIVGLSRCLAREFGGYGITVSVMTLGLTVTPPVQESFPPEMLEKARGARALKRDEQPEDLVGAVFFLASPNANFMTGQIINVDGGNHMH